MSNGGFWSSVWSYFNGASGSSGWAGNALGDMGSYDPSVDPALGNPVLGDLLGADSPTWPALDPFGGSGRSFLGLGDFPTPVRGSQEGGGTVSGGVAASGASRSVSYTGTPAQTTKVTTLSDGSVLVGPSGGLQFHLFWDSSDSSAPSAFKGAVEAAAGYYSQMYSNDEVINIDVGWGEADGIPIGSGALAASVRPGIYRSYSQVLSGLDKDAGNSSVQAQADSTLPSTDPLGADYYYVPFAEAKTLGEIPATGAETDGYVGMSNTLSLDFSQPTAAGYYDAVGAMEHEISEVMGRVGAVGAAYGSGLYTPLDLFRYSAPGVRATSISAPTPYFSIDAGVTNLGSYNATRADFGDWNNTRGDAYGSASPGTTLAVTPHDLIEDAALGYNFTAMGLAAAKLSA